MTRLCCPQYEDRMPIGKESIIQSVPAFTVKAFYERWYRPENMAVVAIGDFADPDAVVDMIRHQMEKVKSASPQSAPTIPRYVFRMLDMSIV